MRLSGLKKNILFILMIIVFSVQVVQAASSKEEKLKLLEKLEKLDMLDKLDRLDFQDAIDTANNCTKERRFSCTLNNITKAEELAETSEQVLLIQYARQDYENEKLTVEYEKEIRIMEEDFRRKERMRRWEEEEKQEALEKELKRQARLDAQRQRDAEHEAATAEWERNLNNKLSQWSADMQRSNEQFNQTLSNNLEYAQNFQERETANRRKAEQDHHEAIAKMREENEKRRLAFEQQKREREAEQKRVREQRQRDQEQALARVLQEKKNTISNNIGNTYKKECSLIRHSIANNFNYQEKQAACYFDANNKDRQKAEIRTCMIELDKSYEDYARSVYSKENRPDCLKEKVETGISNTIER